MIKEMMDQMDGIDPDAREAIARRLVEGFLPTLHELIDKLPEVVSSLARMDEGSELTMSSILTDVLSHPQVAEALRMSALSVVRLDMAVTASPQLQAGVQVTKQGLMLLQGGLGSVDFTEEMELEAQQRVEGFFTEPAEIKEELGC